MNALNRYDLRVRTEGYSNDYDSTCNPSIFNEFATAAFRYVNGGGVFVGLRTLKMMVKCVMWYVMHTYYINIFTRERVRE